MRTQEIGSRSRGCFRCKKPITPLQASVHGLTAKGLKWRAAHESCVPFPSVFRGIEFVNFYNPAALEGLKARIPFGR